MIEYVSGITIIVGETAEYPANKRYVGWDVYRYVYI